MEDYRRFDDTVTEFLLNTTRLRPRLTRHAVDAAIEYGGLATKPPLYDEEAANIPLTTGSVAEFCIEPMHECFGDIDIMFHHNYILAIPRGHSPPTQLPDEFHNYVKVHEIIDCLFPGYAYLELRYLLTQSSDNDTYNAIEYDSGMFLSNRLVGQRNTSDPHTIEEHGPARQYSMEGLVTVDRVHCVRCLVWPPQAADWPTRLRNYVWPDSATVDRVVSNGCDLVGVAHRQYRQQEVTGKGQWRMSFSRAEIALINSWMPLQQIVYHLLRVFLKTERLTESADNSGSSTLSNYHIKTLMLWACELKPRSWWTDNFSFTAICADLLNLLAQWLNQGYCPHYFMPYCNLFDHCDRANQILAAERLSEINKIVLIKWFLCSYLPKCYQRCPVPVVRQFVDVSTSDKLQRAVSAVVEWRRSHVLLDNWQSFRRAKRYIMAYLAPKYVASVRSYEVWIKQLTKLDPKLCDYLLSVFCLHVSLKVSNHRSAVEFTNLLNTASHASGWDVNLLMNMSTSQLVEFLQKSAIDILTAFRHLQARDFGSLVAIVTTDFEAMYAYKRGDYQYCLQLCTQNVCSLWHAVRVESVQLRPEFLQLLDDDIVSLTALPLIVNPQCRHNDDHYYCITQVTLSLYLMARCQLKLRHSVTSLGQTLNCIEVAQRRHLLDRTLDQLTLKLAERKILTHISKR